MTSSKEAHLTAEEVVRRRTDREAVNAERNKTRNHASEAKTSFEQAYRFAHERTRSDSHCLRSIAASLIAITGELVAIQKEITFTGGRND